MYRLWAGCAWDAAATLPALVWAWSALGFAQGGGGEMPMASPTLPLGPFALAAWTGANLGVTGAATHAWYQSRFPGNARVQSWAGPGEDRARALATNAASARGTDPEAQGMPALAAMAASALPAHAWPAGAWDVAGSVWLAVLAALSARAALAVPSSGLGGAAVSAELREETALAVALAAAAVATVQECIAFAAGRRRS